MLETAAVPPIISVSGVTLAAKMMARVTSATNVSRLPAELTKILYKIEAFI